jgi:hypothetical protein
MLNKYQIPAPTAGVHTNGQAPAGKTVKGAVTGQQRRALRKLFRDLVTFTGTAASELAAAPRSKAPQRPRQRLLYRSADSLTDADLDRLVAEIGIDRIWRAVEKLTQPPLPFMAAE